MRLRGVPSMAKAYAASAVAHCCHMKCNITVVMSPKVSAGVYLLRTLGSYPRNQGC